MQIKTTMRYHFTTVRMVIIKKLTNNKCWRECREKTALLQCGWECKLVQLLWRTAWRFLKKLKIELPYHPAIPLLGMYLEKIIIQKRYMHPSVHRSTIYSSQDMILRRSGKNTQKNYSKKFLITWITMKICLLN